MLLCASHFTSLAWSRFPTFSVFHYDGDKTGLVYHKLYYIKLYFIILYTQFRTSRDHYAF